MATQKSTQADFDLIFKNGNVFPGRLDYPIEADVGIHRDKIEFAGRIEAKAAKTIDAKDRIVTPGFIDIHTHCDLTFLSLEGQGEQIANLPGVKENLYYLYLPLTEPYAKRLSDKTNRAS